MHPATQCWCGHAASLHADFRRTAIGGCRAGCPCTGFRAEDDQIPVDQLTDLLVGMSVALGTILGTMRGTITAITHDNGMTCIALDDDRQVMLRSDLPCSISIDWTNMP